MRRRITLTLGLVLLAGGCDQSFEKFKHPPAPEPYREPVALSIVRPEPTAALPSYRRNDSDAIADLELRVMRLETQMRQDRWNRVLEKTTNWKPSDLLP